MAFLDQLTALLGGQPAATGGAAPVGSGMTNYGAMPSAGGGPVGASSPTAQVLARLNPTTQAMARGFGIGGSPSAPGSNPTGVTMPGVGGNLATAISGLSAVDPTASKFGAFAQGLAGGLGARERALGANAQYGLDQQKTALEAVKDLTAADVQNRQQNLAEASAARKMSAMSAVQALLTGQQPGGAGSMQASAPAQPQGAPMALPSASGGGAPAAGSPPAASPPSSAAPAPMAPQPPGVQTISARGGPAVSSPPAATAAASPPTLAAPMPPTTSASAPRLDPESDPHFLEQRAQTLDQAAMLAAGFDPESATRYGNTANQIRQKAQQIRATGLATDTNGQTMVLPGYTDAQAEIARSKAAAEQTGKNDAAPQSSPSGATYIPPPPGFKSTPGSQQPLDPPPGATIGNTPPTMQTDPKTAAVQTAIPAAPAGGGFPLPDIPPGAKLTKPGDAAMEQAKTDASNFANLTGQMPAIDSGIERYQSLAQAFKLFQSGSGTEHLAAGAAIAQSFGYPDIAKKILSGDPAAVQWVGKEGVQLTLDTLKAAQPRFAQSEFNQLATKGTPDPNKLPEANHQLIAEGLGTMLRNKAFIQDWQTAQQHGWQSPSAFYSSWSSANPLGGFVRSAQQQIGNFKGMDLPSATEWKQGASYVAPLQMTDQQAAAFAKRGIKPGQAFRFNGAGSAQALTPIGQGNSFTSQLPGG